VLPSAPQIAMTFHAGRLAIHKGETRWLSAAEARRFVDHCCLVNGAAHGQPGRVLARFHPTVMVCALTYLKRLASMAESAITAEPSSPHKGGMPPADGAGTLALLSSLLEEDSWQVIALTVSSFSPPCSDTPPMPSAGGATGGACARHQDLLGLRRIARHERRAMPRPLGAAPGLASVYRPQAAPSRAPPAAPARLPHDSARQ
jgi:hypothetical protein